jgi:transcriptional regulator with XRE-family HTH domain
MATMRKQIKFQKLAKDNRKKLLECGFLPSTVSMWVTGDRVPTWDNAMKIAKILGVKTGEIPYYKTERIIS